MNEPEGVPELQGPPEVLEAIDRFLADPSTGVRAGRPQRKVRMDPEDVENAEIEEEPSPGDGFPGTGWLLLILGVIVLGFLIRWMRRR